MRYKSLFEHEYFDTYEFEEVPLNRDIYLVDDKHLKEYIHSMLKFFNGNDYKHVGSVSYIAARAINKNSIELSWYANVHDRFHEILISLPKSQFITCVGSRYCDEKPRIFVKSTWLESVYLRSYSIFCMIDAIGVKNALEGGSITREKLVKLRNLIDKISAKYKDISFISFADSLLLKSNWSVGMFKSNIAYTYQPEIFIKLVDEINQIYQKTLGLGTYAIITQGSNEYYDDALLHVSSSGNHISLNSLGVPFAQIMEIEHTARKAIKENVHAPAELYLDDQYYHSLNYVYEFDKNSEPSNSYCTKMRDAPSKYYYSSIERIASSLENEKI